MARRRVTADRAWYFNEGQVILNTDLDAQIQDIVNFGDIEVDSALTRDRSEFYFQRMIFWGVLGTGGAGASLNLPTNLVTVRIGQIDTDLWDKDVEEGLVQSPDFVPEDWTRIYQEGDFLVHRDRHLVFDGAALITSVSESGNSTGYPVPPLSFAWDMRFKSRLMDEQSIVVMLGQRFIEETRTTSLTWRCKALLQRGR